MKNLLPPPRATLVGAASLTALSLAFSAPAQALLINPVDWTSASGTSAAGAFVGGPSNGTTVNLSGAGSPALQNFNLSRERYSYAPLSATQEVVRYRSQSDLTVGFNNPVSNLLLYAFLWEGGTTGATYTFSSPFVVRSGFDLTGPVTGVTFTSTTLTIPANTNSGGILDFGGAPLNSFTVNSSLTTGTVNNALTFATAVPLETDALPVVVGAAFMAGGLWWKKKRAGAKVSDFIAQK